MTNVLITIKDQYKNDLVNIKSKLSKICKVNGVIGKMPIIMAEIDEAFRTSIGAMKEVDAIEDDIQINHY